MDDDEKSRLVSFSKEGGVPDIIKTLCNTGQVKSGANISRIVGYLEDGSVNNTIKTLCNIVK